MTARIAALLAWLGCAGAVVLVGAGAFLSMLGREPRVSDFAFVFATVAFAIVGVLVASRRAGNAIGWIFLLMALLGGITAFAGEYATYGLVTRPGSLPGAVLSAWVFSWVWYPTLALPYTFVLLLFPDGRLPSRRWRPVAWLAGALVVVPILVMAVWPGSYEDQGLPASVTNPFGIDVLGGEWIDTFIGVTEVVLLALGLVCVASLLLRFRRSHGDERQQLKWIAYAAALLGLWGLADLILRPAEWVSDIVLVVAFLALPAATGMAVLKYRLYEIDRIVSRTVSYTLLTGLLGAVYGGGVVLLGTLLRADSELAVTGSTLAVAVLFGPARRRIQALVDRRFNRARYDAARTVEAFSARLRDEVDLDQLRAELLAAVHQTVQPAQASLWLRGTGR